LHELSVNKTKRDEDLMVQVEVKGGTFKWVELSQTCY
jgi:hypothetical protein